VTEYVAITFVIICMLCCTVILGGDSLKHKFDTISDTVTDNVRETGKIVMC